MAFAFVGNVIVLAARYAPLVLGVIKTGYELISALRNETNPVTDISQTAQDNIDHINVICDSINSLLGGGFPPLPDVNSPSDLPGWLSVVSQYFEAYRSGFCDPLSSNLVVLRSQLLPSATDFTGDESRAGGVDLTSASSLTAGSNGQIALANVTSIITQFTQFFPIVTEQSDAVFPLYAAEEEYTYPGYNVLQRKTYSGYLQAAADGLADLATGGPICPVDGYNLVSTSGPWLLDAESGGLEVTAFASVGGADMDIGWENTENTSTGWGALELYAAFLPGQVLPGAGNFADPDAVDLGAMLEAYDIADGYMWQVRLNGENGGLPPKFPDTYHWILPTIINWVATSANPVDGIFIRLSADPGDGVATTEDASYYFTTRNTLNQEIFIGIDCYNHFDKTPNVYLTVIPSMPTDQAVSSVPVDVVITFGNPYGLLTDAGLSASDITYFDASGVRRSINNATTFFDLLGQCTLDDTHDDPNASVPALFTQRFGAASQAFGQVLGAYYQYLVNTGVNPDSVYGPFGFTLRKLVDMKSWLSVDSPMATLTPTQRAQVIRKLIYDIYSVLEYSQFNSALSALLVNYSEPLPMSAAV